MPLVGRAATCRAGRERRRASVVLFLSRALRTGYDAVPMATAIKRAAARAARPSWVALLAAAL
ncbi:MAG: hypothetical protein ABFD84_06180, partial [Candidatus Polarisedimenticolia bacterium]